MIPPPERERWPDFLLIGAPKVGTTALFKTLSRHPQIDTSLRKEPRFFICSGSKPNFPCPGGNASADTITYLEKDYLELFKNCPDQLQAGEASTAYLHHPNAPALACDKVPCARIITVLRHPVDRAYSQWLHLRQEGHEILGDFEAAWNLEQDRKAKGWRTAWLYRERGLYAEQLDRWLSYYPREQILILFYEDWLERPLETLGRVYKHLGVQDFDSPLLTRENVSSRQPRWKWLHHRMVQDNALRTWARGHLPLWVRDAITVPISKVNLKAGRRIDPSLRARLAITFHEDIDRLEVLTGRDLGHWRH